VIATDAPVNQREAILDHALVLMSSRGAAGMSMRQLASACGLHVAAIYHYFDSKDALLAAVVAERRYRARLVEPLPIDPALPGPERLRALFLHVWSGTLEEESIWRLLLGEGIRGEPAVVQAGGELMVLVESAARGWVTEVLPELACPELVARLLVDQLLAGFVRSVFDGPAATTSGGERSDRHVAEGGAAALVEAVFG
jgi:AcrR family transcriptional regulator